MTNTIFKHAANTNGGRILVLMFFFYVKSSFVSFEATIFFISPFNQKAFKIRLFIINFLPIV
jgi:hypothetical protein